VSGRVVIPEFGDYNNPQAILTTGPSPAIHGQWWFDFSRIAEANISLFFGIEIKRVVGANFFPQFGMFLLPDGDANPPDLFNTILPAVQLVCFPVATYGGFDASATIANPGIKRQIVFAHTIGTIGTSGLVDTTWDYRSILFDVKGV
jgi:hypothetical protein